MENTPLPSKSAYPSASFPTWLSSVHCWPEKISTYLSCKYAQFCANVHRSTKWFARLVFEYHRKALWHVHNVSLVTRVNILWQFKVQKWGTRNKTKNTASTHQLNQANYFVTVLHAQMPWILAKTSLYLIRFHQYSIALSWSSNKINIISVKHNIIKLNSFISNFNKKLVTVLATKHIKIFMKWIFSLHWKRSIQWNKVEFGYCHHEKVLVLQMYTKQTLNAQ